MAEQAAIEYSKYFNVEPEKEVKDVKDSLENMLTHLEECNSTLNIIQSVEKQRDELMEKILSMKNSLAELTQRIDSVEMFISRVHQDMNALETQLIEAGLDLPAVSKSKLKTLLKPFISKISPEITAETLGSTSRVSSQYQKIDIFSTDSFFKSDESDVGKEPILE